jgi:alpha-tubulin suppressor-like RCC1 family protein
LWCWGYNGNGRLGDGTTLQRTVPVQVGTDTDWSAVSAGGLHTCGIRASALYCWGANADGQLGLGREGTPSGRATPGLVAGGSSGWTTVVAGSNHTCGLNNGQLWCWGQNTYGQVGDGSGINRTVPVRVGTANDWTAVGVGSYHSCGVRAQTTWCWGWNANGQVGDGTTVNRLGPVQVGTKTDWDQVDGGYAHTVGSRNVPVGE